MRTHWKTWIAAAAPTALLVGVVALADSVTEREIKLEDVPQLARATILDEAGTHALTELEELNVEGVIYYGAEWRDGDDEVEVVVDSEGKIVGRETEPWDGEDDDGDDDADQGDDDSADDDGERG